MNDCSHAVGVDNWRNEYEQQMITALKKRWHRVQKLIAQGYDEDDILQEVRIRLWKAVQRYDASRGYPLEKWLAYQTDYVLRDFERGRY